MISSSRLARAILLPLQELSTESHETSVKVTLWSIHQSANCMHVHAQSTSNTRQTLRIVREYRAAESSGTDNRRKLRTIPASSSLTEDA